VEGIDLEPEFKEPLALLNNVFLCNIAGVKKANIDNTKLLVVLHDMVDFNPRSVYKMFNTK